MEHNGCSLMGMAATAMGRSGDGADGLIVMGVTAFWWRQLGGGVVAATMKAFIGLMGAVVQSLMGAFDGLMEAMVISSMGAVCSVRASVGLMGAIMVGLLGYIVGSMRAIVSLMGAVLGGLLGAAISLMRAIVDLVGIIVSSMGPVVSSIDGSMAGNLMLEDDSKWWERADFERSRPVGRCGEPSA